MNKHSCLINELGWGNNTKIFEHLSDEEQDDIQFYRMELPQLSYRLY